VEEEVKKQIKPKVTIRTDYVKPERKQEIIDNCSRIILNYYRNKDKTV
jgi:hypothetical protein